MQTTRLTYNAYLPTPLCARGNYTSRHTAINIPSTEPLETAHAGAILLYNFSILSQAAIRPGGGSKMITPRARERSCAKATCCRVVISFLRARTPPIHLGCWRARARASDIWARERCALVNAPRCCVLPRCCTCRRRCILVRELSSRAGGLGNFGFGIEDWPCGDCV